MNSLFKIGVAGALALSGSVVAHAGITVGTSSFVTGDVVLYADVFNSSGSLVQSYAGDTGVAVSSVASGILPPTFKDTNLGTLLTAATGNTLVWALEGGGGINSGGSNAGEELISSGTKAAIGIDNLSGNTLAGMVSGLDQAVKNGINPGLGSATSGLFGTSTAAPGLGGSGFNPNALAADATNWFGNTGNIATTGLNTSSSLFLLTSTDQSAGTSALLSTLFNVSLTSSGLTFTALGGTVPLPPAIWLLGSGLLALAAVGRRKAGFPNFA